MDTNQETNKLIKQLRAPINTILIYCHQHCFEGHRCDTCFLKTHNDRACPIYSYNEQCHIFNVNLFADTQISDKQLISAVYEIISQCGHNKPEKCNRVSCPLFRLSPRDCAYDFHNSLKAIVHTCIRYEEAKTQRRKKGLLYMILKNNKNGG